MHNNAYYITLKTWLSLINKSNFPKLYELIKIHNLNQILNDIKISHQQANTDSLEKLADQITELNRDLKATMYNNRIKFYANDKNIISTIIAEITKKIKVGQKLTVAPVEIFNLIYFVNQYLIILLKSESALININLILLKANS